jgi:hypothetical protein
MIWIVYLGDDGEIEYVGTSTAPHLETDFIEVESETMPSRSTHKIVDGVLMGKTDSEKILSNIPKRFEIECLIFSELNGTDCYIVADRPMSDERRAQWKAYRQTLRDLSKIASPAAMVAAWPVRPDEQDAALLLRERLPK